MIESESPTATESDSPLHVERLGRRNSAETFVLLHGFGGSSYTWRHWTPALEQRGKVALIDLKGFGDAAKPDDGRYDPETQAELVDAVVEREGHTRVTLVGHSYGGGVALLTALRMIRRGDTRLARLVLVASAAYPQRLPPFVRLGRHPRLSGLALALATPERIVRAVLRSIVHDPACIDEGQVRAYSAALKRGDGVRAMFAAARQIVPDHLDELTAQYPRISCPTLLLWGRGDRVIPLAIGRRLRSEIPRSRLEVLESCGHVPHEELPEPSLAVLERFLDQTAEATGISAS